MPSSHCSALRRCRRLFLESLEDRQLLAANWRNPVDSLDINNDRQITAFDAIEVVRELNLNGTHALPATKPADKAFWDVTGNNQLSAFDAIAVINQLNLHPLGSYSLQEQAGRINAQQSVTITSGNVQAGTRTYQLKVQPQFDLTDTQSASEDIFTVSLFNPLTGTTVIDSGSNGSGMFALRGGHAEVGNGLVQWDGTFLSIDLTQIAAETLELRLQLLNPDTDHGSQVKLTPWSNVIDPLGVPRTPGTLRSSPTPPASVVTNMSSYLQIPTLDVELENPIYDASTGLFTAEARLVNNSEATVTNGIIRLPTVSAAAVVNRSGQVGSIPYWNFASVIDANGVAPGAKSGWLKIEVNVGNDSFPWRPDARGYTSSEHIAQFGVFSTSFAEAQERQIFHMPLEAGEHLLTLSLGTTSGTDVRWLNPNGSEVPFFQTFQYESHVPLAVDLSGDFQFEMTSESAGNRAVAFQKLDNLTELTIGSEFTGYLDPRLGPKVFAFYGTESQRIVLENRLPVDAAQNMSWRVIDAVYGYEADVITPGAGGDVEVELFFSGLHYLVLQGPANDTQFRPYDFILRSPVQIVEPLILGSSHSSSFQSFSEERHYTFQPAFVGQRFVMDILRRSNSSVDTYLINPNGLRVPFNPFQPFLIDVLGTWKVVVKGSNPDFFQFSLQDVGNLSAFGTNATFGGTVSSEQSAFFRVSAGRNERLTFVNNNGSGALAQLYSQSGNLFTPIGTHQFHATEVGEDLLRIFAPTTTPVQFSFTLQKALDAPVTAAGLDTDYTGSLSPGATTLGTFTASAGLQLMFDKFAAANDTSGFSVRITGLDFDQTFNKDSGVLTLRRSGTYTMQSINSGAAAVPYGFRIVDLANTPLLSDGERITSTLTGGKTLVRRVPGTIGKLLAISSLTADPANDTADLTMQVKTEFGALTTGFSYYFQATKTYFLTIEQESAADRPLQLQASLTSNAAALPMGSPFSGTLGPNGGVKLYRFQAQRGQFLHLDALALSASLKTQVFDNTMQQLTTTTPNAWRIHRTGEYFLWLQTDQAAPVSFTLQSSFWSAPIPIAFNSVVSGTLGAGESRTYSVTTTAGTPFYFDGLDEGSPAQVIVKDPDGEPVTAAATTAGNSMFLAQRPGRYLITISDSTLPYSFRILDAQAAPLFPLNINALGTIVADKQTRIWRIPATEGQRLYVDSNASVASPFLGSITLYSPPGYLIGSTVTTTNNDLATTAFYNGNHYLVINGSNTPFDYDLRLRTSEKVIVPITLGTTVSGLLEDPGDTVEYVFQGTRGQHIHLEGLTNAAFRIVTPDGIVLPTTEGFGSLLPISGEYRIRVFSSGNQLNMDYRFQLVDVATLPLLPLNTVISGSTTQGEWLMYRLPGTNGARYAFDSQYFSGPTTNNSWRLISPQATFAFPPAAFIDGDRTFTLTDSGDYVFVVRLSGGAIDYAFQVNTVAQPAVTVAGLNQTYSGSVVNFNVTNFSFTGTAGQRVFLDVLDQATLPAARLLGPDGSVVETSAVTDRMLVLPLAGNYNLEISGSGSPTPRNFRFRLVDASNLPITPQDTPFAINITQSYQGEAWAFSAAAGDQLAIETGTVPINSSFRVLQPDGKLLTIAVGQPQVVTMQQTGRHYLVMDASDSPPVSTVGHIWNVQNLPIGNEAPINVHFTASEWHLFSFDLTLGDRIHFAPLVAAPAQLQFAFTQPRGLGPIVSLDDAADPDAFTVDRAGRYTLVVNNASGVPADFSFQIHIVPLREVFGVARD